MINQHIFLIIDIFSVSGLSSKELTWKADLADAIGKLFPCVMPISTFSYKSIFTSSYVW
jgi:hypothetical protein